MSTAFFKQDIGCTSKFKPASRFVRSRILNDFMSSYVHSTRVMSCDY